MVDGFAAGSTGSSSDSVGGRDDEGQGGERHHRSTGILYCAGLGLGTEVSPVTSRRQGYALPRPAHLPRSAA
ncbi:hypothetical protein BH23CHL5_BH23CHL5_27070 [soil metagenome]